MRLIIILPKIFVPTNVSRLTIVYPTTLQVYGDELKVQIKLRSIMK
jgi:hypothetical protein